MNPLRRTQSSNSDSAGHRNGAPTEERLGLGPALYKGDQTQPGCHPERRRCCFCAAGVEGPAIPANRSRNFQHRRTTSQTPENSFSTASYQGTTSVVPPGLFVTISLADFSPRGYCKPAARQSSTAGAPHPYRPTLTIGWGLVVYEIATSS